MNSLRIAIFFASSKFFGNFFKPFVSSSLALYKSRFTAGARGRPFFMPSNPALIASASARYWLQLESGERNSIRLSSLSAMAGRRMSWLRFWRLQETYSGASNSPRRLYEDFSGFVKRVISYAWDKIPAMKFWASSQSSSPQKIFLPFFEIEILK